MKNTLMIKNKKLRGYCVFDTRGKPVIITAGSSSIDRIARSSRPFMSNQHLMGWHRFIPGLCSMKPVSLRYSRRRRWRHNCHLPRLLPEEKNLNEYQI